LACSCKYTIEAYAQEQRFREAFALTDRVREYLRQVRTNKTEITKEDILFSTTALQEAEQSIQALYLRLQASWTRYEDRVNSNISDKMVSLSIQGESSSLLSTDQISASAITKKVRKQAI
jgi:hypothetical protein